MIKKSPVTKIVYKSKHMELNWHTGFFHQRKGQAQLLVTKIHARLQFLLGFEVLHIMQNCNSEPNIMIIFKKYVEYSHSTHIYIFCVDSSHGHVILMKEYLF